MASLRKLFTDSVVYGLSSIVGRFLNYLLVPVYTYHISAASGGYGVVTNLYAYTALMLVVLTFGMETTFFYFANRSGADKRRVFATSLGAVGAVCVVFVAVVLLGLSPISTAMGYASHPEYVAVMACVVAMDAVQSIFFARLRLEGRAWRFAALKLTFIVLNIALNLMVFLVLPHWAGASWMGWYDESHNVGYIFYINLLCTAVVGLLFLSDMRGVRLRMFDRSLLRPMLRYSLPLLLLGIVGILNQVVDKILFPYLMPGHEGEVQLSIYGACVKIAMIMAMITQAFRYAYEPFVFADQRGGKSKENQAVVMKLFVAATMFAFMAVMAYIDVLKYVVGSDYHEGLRAVPIVMMAEILMGIYFNLSFWYKLTGRTWWGAVMSGVGSVVMIGFNVAFVPQMGYMACAWGGLCGYAVCVLLSFFIGRHYYPVPYDLLRIATFVLCGLALTFVMHMCHALPLGWRLAVNTLLLAAYVAVVAVAERKMIAPLIGKLTHLKR
ncbi:MAG: lipopolysaccharide biosynthesis protein [Bacteroidales bacterium]|nr:lipopolysaccharide biosynthesis protein [Bacteroidales bacterium]